MDEIYRDRAAPRGSARYWCLQFAPADARGPLLGIFALLAEWRALGSPAMEPSVAHAKLAWWSDEMERLAQGRPVHPISRFVQALPRAAEVDLGPLRGAIEAAAREGSRVPLERGADLEPHASDLVGTPLWIAAELSAPDADAGLLRSTRSLGVAEYLSGALNGYRKEARAGRVVFPVDELLRAGIETSHLLAPVPPEPLRRYLAEMRDKALDGYRRAERELTANQRPGQRGLLVLGELGLRHLLHGGPPREQTMRLRDLLWSWRAARRALAPASTT